ncbi:MAG TPA: hypothetical protein VGB67_00300 [Fibrella sp.]
MTQAYIHDQLRIHFDKGWMHLSNVYVFNWESDFLCWVDKQYWCEVEVKVSRPDFFRDFTHKPKKHLMLQQALKNKRGRFLTAGREYEHHTKLPGKRGILAPATELHTHMVPHRFYYAAPKGLIKLSEVPKYAGLIEFDVDLPFKSQTRIVKRPVTLHKEPIEIMGAIAVKQHFKIEQMRKKMEALEHELQRCQGA